MNVSFVTLPETYLSANYEVLIKHVLCFVRIMSLSARIDVDKLPELGGGQLPPDPPVPYAYAFDGFLQK